MWPLSLFTIYLWRIYKWVMHILTGKSELERIASQQINTNEVLKNIESYIVASRELKQFCGKSYDKRRKMDIWYLNIKYHNLDDEKQLTDQILRIKRFNSNNTIAITNLKKALCRMIRVNHAIFSLGKLRNEVFSYDNKEHVQMLDDQWSLMKPHTERLDRITDQWADLGYQGKDPATDFRGMGILGLHNLLYYARNDTENARTVLFESHHPINWYSFAIAGINFTAELYEQVSTYKHNSLFYNVNSTEDVFRVFNELYIRAFTQFHEYWKQQNATVMQFNDKKREFFDKRFRAHQ
jgi:hypothetical protein